MNPEDGHAAAATFDPTLEALLVAVRGCRECEAHLPLGPRPVLRARATARILVVGQAPGARVHATGIPWDDPSGERLRTWMGVDQQVFYDESRIAIIPMGFCYPGRGRGGDVPPRRECATLWLDQLLARLPDIELTLLIGHYAQRRFLGGRRKQSLTATVRAWQDYAPHYLPLPQPSPRNQPWFKRHRWLERARPGAAHTDRRAGGGLNREKHLWTAYSTGPDSEVLIDGDANAKYPSHKGKDLGVSTWPGDQWKRGGGPTWGWYSYDPELDLFYYSTGNPGTWNPDQRPGDNKWAMTIFARKPETGKVVWAYQMTPHDEWDYDGVNENVLFESGGKKLLAHFDRNGSATPSTGPTVRCSWPTPIVAFLKSC